MSLPPLPPGFRDLLEKAQKAKADLEAARQGLRERTVEGRAGGGMVVATCDGTGELVKLRFEPGLLAKEEASLVEDLVVAAVRDARRKAAELERSVVGDAMGGLAPGGALPDLSGLFG